MAHAKPLNNTVSITAFNRGKAGEIFSNVKKSGMTVVMKNNEPECVLFSPAQYEALIDEQLLAVAEERLQWLDPEDIISFEDVCREAGIRREEIDQMEEVELE